MAPGPVLTVASLESQLGFARECPIPAQLATILDCFIAQVGWPRQNTGGGRLWPVPPGKPQSLHLQWTATDHTGAPPPCSCTTDRQRAEVGGQWSQPVLADWSG